MINNNLNKSEASTYKIPCANCPLPYVDQTGKSLEARIKQHKYSIRSGQENTAFFQHVRGFNHRINFDLTFVFKCNSNFTERKKQEKVQEKEEGSGGGKGRGCQRAIRGTGNGGRAEEDL